MTDRCPDCGAELLPLEPITLHTKPWRFKCRRWITATGEVSEQTPYCNTQEKKQLRRALELASEKTCTSCLDCINLTNCDDEKTSADDCTKVIVKIFLEQAREELDR